MEAPLMHLALVGTPNSGKTSLFNALTGSRQKVANYPGVTVERKEGFFVTPLGRQASLVDLPGTYSLRGRSPDEEITRDFVLGRAAGETLPDLVLCVADSTNLRLTIRLLLELKQTGRPLMLVLNMFDIATRRGVTVDAARMSEMLGVPVVTSIAVRKSGIADLLRKTDEIAMQAEAPPRENLWKPLSVAELRATQREADRIIGATVSLPAKPDTWTGRIDAVVLHPVAGLVDPRPRAVRDVPGGVRLGAAADGAVVGCVFGARSIRARHAACRVCCKASCKTARSPASAASSCSCRRSSSFSCSSCCWKISATWRAQRS